MADYKVKMTGSPIKAVIEVPGSKSITNRALLISALSSGRSFLKRVLFSDDSRVFMRALQDLGFCLISDEIKHETVVDGAGGLLCGSCGSEESSIFKQVSLQNNRSERTTDDNGEPLTHLPGAGYPGVYAGSAGTAARFLTALLALSDGEYFIDASEQMKKRPMLPLFKALTELGAVFDFPEKEGFLPVKVKGAFADGEDIKRDTAIVASDESTQFLSALLMMSPVIAKRTGRPFRIKVTGSRAEGAYVSMTRKVMRDFGVGTEFVTGKNEFLIMPSEYSACRYEVEPDVSAACYFYAAAAITGGEVVVKGVHSDSCQGDLRFLDILVRMGCTREEKPEGIMIRGPEGGKLHGITADMKDFSDQTMTLAAIAPFCDSPVEITGIGHIRGQESDRISAVANELNRMGVQVDEGNSGLKIYPGTPVPAHIETYNDHRIAMAFALTGLRSSGIVIKDAECCKKTFEDFFVIFDNMING